MLYKAFKYKKLISMLILGLAFSQTFAQYEIRKQTINSGASTMKEGQYELTTSIAQVDANGTITSGDYSLNAGFWQENKDLIKKNGFE